MLVRLSSNERRLACEDEREEETSEVEARVQKKEGEKKGEGSRSLIADPDKPSKAPSTELWFVLIPVPFSECSCSRKPPQEGADLAEARRRWSPHHPSFSSSSESHELLRVVAESEDERERVLVHILSRQEIWSG